MTQLFEWDYSGYPGAKKYPNVFKPITIGKLTIPNRVKYAATEDNLNSHDGFVTDEDVAYIQAGRRAWRAASAPFRVCIWTNAPTDRDTSGRRPPGTISSFPV